MAMNFRPYRLSWTDGPPHGFRIIDAAGSVIDFVPSAEPLEPQAGRFRHHAAYEIAAAKVAVIVR